jgi:sec-independent protein translocase protein TatA
MRIFKSEIKEMQSDSKQDTPSSDVAGRATPIASERADSAAAPAPEAVPPPDQRPA